MHRYARTGCRNRLRDAPAHPPFRSDGPVPDVTTCQLRSAQRLAAHVRRTTAHHKRAPAAHPGCRLARPLRSRGGEPGRAAQCAPGLSSVRSAISILRSIPDDPMRVRTTARGGLAHALVRKSAQSPAASPRAGRRGVPACSRCHTTSYPPSGTRSVDRAVAWPVWACQCDRYAQTGPHHKPVPAARSAPVTRPWAVCAHRDEHRHSTASPTSQHGRWGSRCVPAPACAVTSSGPAVGCALSLRSRLRTAAHSRLRNDRDGAPYYCAATCAVVRHGPVISTDQYVRTGPRHGT